MTEIPELSAVELQAAIKSKRLSAVEVMSAYLDRIDDLNPRLNAIVSLQDRQSLFTQAAGKDREIRAGASIGPLHGFPIAIKDSADTKGIKTTYGSPLLADNMPTTDEIFVERIKAAGAIIIGKTNVPEFALGSHTFNPVFGTTANAYDPRKTAGGSSGGAATAVASRMLVLADGSDLGGSLRNPAAFNNIFSLRPSIGTIPSLSPSPFETSMAVNGPMARSVDDLGLLMSVMAGHDARSPLSREQDPSVFAHSLDANIAGTRIAWLGDLGGHLPMEDGILALCQSSLDVFRHLGCHVETELPSFNFEQIWLDWVTLRSWSTMNWLMPYYEDPEKRKLLKPEALWEIERGKSLNALQLRQAALGRGRWFAVLQEFMKNFDFILLPSAQVFPFDTELRWPKAIAGNEMDTYHRWMEVVVAVTMSGCPVLNVPVGFNPDGLPMGMQIVGRFGDEIGCLRLASSYDQETRWVQRRPPNMEMARQN
ncbi:amidase [Rhizobium sp. NPDC090279]|uniref:amidase n=1 Tax=Rhizobium sp. NPDC090279 TaxID=3364499 RepID=UPI00383A1E3E